MSLLLITHRSTIKLFLDLYQKFLDISVKIFCVQYSYIKYACKLHGE